MRLLQRVKNILFKPRLEWDLIAAEKNSFRSLFTGYVLPLALPGAVAAMMAAAANTLSLKLIFIADAPLDKLMSCLRFQPGSLVEETSRPVRPTSNI